MYIIDLIKLRNIFCNAALDFREKEQPIAAEILNRIERAFTSSAVCQSLEDLIDERAKKIVADVLNSIATISRESNLNSLFVTRFMLEKAAQSLSGTQPGNSNTPNDGPLASPAADVDPSATYVVRLENIVRRIIDDREACGIDETDPDDPMASIVRAAREVLNRPAPSRLPIE